MKRLHSVFGGRSEAPLRRFNADAGPSVGFSAQELDAAGLSVEEARRAGIRLDDGRTSTISTNVAALKRWMVRL